MRAEPITCYRPRPDLASVVAAPPYDVFDRAGAAAYVAAHPQSFLAVDRPETGFAPEHDMYADDVYARAHDLLAARVNAGELLRDGTPCFYLYRQRTTDHEQTGIVAAFSVDDYNNGVIRRHELDAPRQGGRPPAPHRGNDLPDRALSFSPIARTPRCEALVEAAKTAAPLYDFRATRTACATPSGASRGLPPSSPFASCSSTLGAPTSWTATTARRRRRASASGSAAPRRARSTPATRRSTFFLGALFPASQLACAPYDRVVADTAGLSEGELVSALEAARQPLRGRAGPALGAGCSGRARAPRDVRVRPPGASCSLPGERPDDVAASLDAALLQELVLGPVLGVCDPRDDARLSFVGGGDLVELERRAGEGGVAFSLFPTSVNELMAVADAGGLMPPKSTWFTPKLMSGLFVRRVCLRECLIDGARPRRREE